MTGAVKPSMSASPTERVGSRGAFAYGDPRHTEPCSLFSEKLGALECRKTDHLERVRIGLDDGQHAAPDRTRGSENRYALAWRQERSHASCRVSPVN